MLVGINFVTARLEFSLGLKGYNQGRRREDMAQSKNMRCRSDTVGDAAAQRTQHIIYF
ncbi:hypothetical protein MANES_12G065075v8 [Manihot esculenta]|uniref:Uncharacterized protein n=1 Tax=Manihot esculenta TaxID=3983 RepID=A0ACB7GPQ8_MANES|nr:hypothetical protein MANES_12G065075v8 [Manihot esculenta]